MGVFEYFSQLMQGKFPQEMFLLWMNVNVPVKCDYYKKPIPSPNVVTELVSMAVWLASLGTAVLFIGLYYGARRFGEIYDQSSFLMSIDQLNFTASPDIWCFLAILALTFSGFVFSASWNIASFKNNLNRFLADFDRLNGILGANIKFKSEVAEAIDRNMVNTAAFILIIEAGTRSKSTESELNNERARMSKMEDIVGKFGFTTRPWGEYFQEASGKPEPNFNLLLSNARNARDQK